MITNPIIIIILLLLVCTWGASAIWTYKEIWINNEAREDETILKVMALVFIFSPGLNHSVCLIWLFENLWKSVKQSSKYIENIPNIFNQYYRIKRKMLIKFGYIKINPNDPYGEEIDDSDQKIEYEKNRY